MDDHKPEEDMTATADAVTRPDLAPLVSHEGALAHSRHPRVPELPLAPEAGVAAPAIETIRVIGGATDTGPGSAPLPGAVLAAPKLAPASPGTTTACSFVQAHWYKKVGVRKIDLIVIHTMEAPEKPTTAMAVASWFATEMKDANGVPRTASAHYCLDNKNVIQCVHHMDVAFCAPGTNHNGIHLEHAGYAAQTDPMWHDKYSQDMLALSAALSAEIVLLYGIPIQFVDAEDLLDGERGITTHREVSRACSLANQRGLTGSPFYNKAHPNVPLTNHTDPGVGWPMIEYLAAVRAVAV